MWAWLALAALCRNKHHRLALEFSLDDQVERRIELEYSQHAVTSADLYSIC